MKLFLCQKAIRSLRLSLRLPTRLVNSPFINSPIDHHPALSANVQLLLLLLLSLSLSLSLFLSLASSHLERSIVYPLRPPQNGPFLYFVPENSQRAPTFIPHIDTFSVVPRRLLLCPASFGMDTSQPS